jgi:hypothetical protein
MVQMTPSNGLGELMANINGCLRDPVATTLARQGQYQSEGRKEMNRTTATRKVTMNVQQPLAATTRQATASHASDSHVDVRV